MRRLLTASQWGLGHCLLPNQWQLEQQPEEGQQQPDPTHQHPQELQFK